MPTEHYFNSGLTESQREAVLARAGADTARAASSLGLPLSPLPVYFDLKGAAAGMFCAREQSQWLRFNPWVFAQDFDLHLADTVPHEVAHYGIHARFGLRRVKPHGVEWRELVTFLGGTPRATYRQNMADIPVRRQRRYTYYCDCREHEVSTTRHNRMQAGNAQYRCRFCNGDLKELPVTGQLASMTFNS